MLNDHLCAKGHPIDQWGNCACDKSPVEGGELDQVGAPVDQVTPWPTATEDDERRARELVDLSFLPMTDEAYEVVARAIVVGRALSASPIEVEK